MRPQAGVSRPGCGLRGCQGRAVLPLDLAFPRDWRGGFLPLLPDLSLAAASRAQCSSQAGHYWAQAPLSPRAVTPPGDG